MAGVKAGPGIGQMDCLDRLPLVLLVAVEGFHGGDAEAQPGQHQDLFLCFELGAGGDLCCFSFRHQAEINHEQQPPEELPVPDFMSIRGPQRKEN